MVLIRAQAFAHSRTTRSFESLLATFDPNAFEQVLEGRALGNKPKVINRVDDDPVDFLGEHACAGLSSYSARHQTADRFMGFIFLH